jgi:hypothetical protein
VEWEFGTFLWAMLAVFFWFAVIWMFVGIFADITRRDMSGWAKAGWVLVIVVLPFLGILIYLVVRPKPVDDRSLGEPRLTASHQRRGYSPADDIATAARLHDEGRISAEEFEHLKQQALIH